MAGHLLALVAGQLAQAEAAQPQLAHVPAGVAREPARVAHRGHGGASLPAAAAKASRRLRTVGTERPSSTATSSRVISST